MRGCEFLEKTDCNMWSCRMFFCCDLDTSCLCVCVRHFLSCAGCKKSNKTLLVCNELRDLRFVAKEQLEVSSHLCLPPVSY